MSSTGRGTKGSDGREFFATPAWCVHRLLEAVPLPGGAWLEPTAGTGNIIRAVNERRSDVTWTAVEKHEPCGAPLLLTGADVVLADFLPTAALFAAEGRRFRVALANPPFSGEARDAGIAFFIALACMEIAEWTIVLQRTSWVGDHAEREARFKGDLPDEYRLGRVDFDGRGGDSTCYSWFAWAPGRRGRKRGQYELLPRTPLGERRAPGQLRLVDVEPPDLQPALFDGEAR